MRSTIDQTKERNGDQFGKILKSLVLQKGRDRARCLCSRSCCLRLRGGSKYLPMLWIFQALLSNPNQFAATAWPHSSERADGASGSSGRFVVVCTVVRVQLKLNRQTLQAPIHLNLAGDGDKVTAPPSAAKSAALASCAIASRASAGTWVITYCLHNSAGGPAGRQPAIRSCRCPRSLSGSQAGGPCRRGLPCHWPCRQMGGGVGAERGAGGINK